MDMKDLVGRWKKMKTDLEKQLAAFEPPMNMRTHSNHQETTAESKARLGRALAELDALVKKHESKPP